MMQFNFKLFRLLEKGIRAGVVLCDAVMTLHCWLLITGRASFLSEACVGVSLFGVAVLAAAGVLLRYCWRYYACLAHMTAVRMCIIIEREAGFGEWLTPARLIMAAIGTLLIVENIRKYVITHYDNA